MIPRRTVMLAAATAPMTPPSFDPPPSAPPVLPQPGGPPPDAGKVMLTIFLRHDESKTVDEINEHLRQTGWYDKFPPPGVEVLTWNVLMGIGQVVTVSFPPDRLRDLNRVIEGAAWGGYRTEFYATYDYRALWEQAKARAHSAR